MTVATYGSRVGCSLAGELALGDQVKRSPANRYEAIHVRVVRDLRRDVRPVSGVRWEISDTPVSICYPRDIDR